MLSCLCFLILIASYWSLGDTINRIFKTPNPKVSQTLTTGLLLFLLQLFLFNVAFGLPYSTVAQVVGVQLIFLFSFNLAFRFRQKWVFRYKELLVVFALTLFAVLFYANSYQPSHWDEFTYWLLMPKQIFLFDQGLTKDFPYTEFLHYPSGVANASVWFMSAFEQSYQESFILVYYLTWFLVFALNFLESMDSTETPVVCWSTFLLSLFLFDFIFPKGALIEPIQCGLIGFCILWILNLENKSFVCSFGRKCFDVSIILMAAYIVKPSTLVVVVLLLSYFLMVFKNNSILNKDKVFALSVSAISIGVFIWLWGFIISDIPRMGFSKNTDNRFHDLESVIQWLVLVFSLLKAVVLKLHSLKGIVLIFPLLILLRNYFPRRLLVSGLVFFVFYILLISFTYSIAFTPDEAALLASYDRYMNLPMFVVFFLTVIGIVSWFKKNGLKYVNHKPALIRILAIVAVIAFVFKTHQHKNKKDRDYVDIFRTYERILANPKLDLTSANGIPQISFLLSDSNCESNHIARYHSIGPKSLKFKVGEVSVFKPTAVNSCTRPATIESLRSWLIENTHVLVVREDEFLKNSLKEILPHCQYEPPFYLSIKSAADGAVLSERVVCGPI